MQPQVLELPELTILGLSKTFRNRDHGAIRQLWESLERSFSDSFGACGSCYGVNQVTDGTVGEFNYTAGLPITADSAPSGLKEVDIPAGQYLVAKTRVGPQDQFNTPEDAVAWLWAEWLPGSEWEGRDDVEFVRFTQGFNFDSRVGEVTLAIPVSERGSSLKENFGF